jgi:hypothetical protein
LITFLVRVGAGVIANLATIVLTLGIGTLIVRARWRALLRFWGIQDTRKLRIYLSHLRIKPGGALDAQGQSGSYQGSVVRQLESEMGALLKNLFFVTIPGGLVQPNWVKALLLVNADVEVYPSPETAEQIESDGSVVSLGSPAYNPVSAAIETHCSSPVRFSLNNRTIQLPGNLEVKDPRQCVVVRLHSGGRFWFYAAGLGEGGTAAATYYLATAWKRLDRVYRASPSFYVVLEVSEGDYRNTRIISEASLDLVITG